MRRYELSHNTGLLPTSTWTGEAPHSATPNVRALSDLRSSRLALRNDAVQHSDSLLEQAIQTVKSETNSTRRAVGAWDIARHGFMTAVNKVARQATSTIDDISGYVISADFKHRFPDLNVFGAECVVAFQATVLHAGVPISGRLYVSTTHVTFHNGDRISTAIPWRDIAAVCECATLQTYTSTPLLIPLPRADVLANAIQLYLRDRNLVEFFDLSPSHADRIADVTNSSIKPQRAASMCYAAVYEFWAQNNGGHSIAEAS